jgi:NAD(P)-dependent dehydrogenase (short-subunit alcohol dehydrogenase family)
MGLLDNKTALITGAASGIGRASALLFSQEGASVVLTDVNVDGGLTLQKEIESLGGRAEFVPCDVTRSEECKSAVEKTVQVFGRLDILFNNAGIIVRQSVVDLLESDWDRVMDVNVKSIYLMSKYAIPAMRSGSGGAIINTSSGWGVVGGPQAAAYCASKGAVVLLTRSMAIDFGPDQIRVNCICPGDTDTSMLRAEAQQLGQAEDQFLLEAADRPLGRVGTAEEIAKAALFLASENSSFVTGTSLIVDGGGLA